MVRGCLIRGADVKAQAQGQGSPSASGSSTELRRAKKQKAGMYTSSFFDTIAVRNSSRSERNAKDHPSFPSLPLRQKASTCRVL